MGRGLNPSRESTKKEMLGQNGITTNTRPIHGELPVINTGSLSMLRDFGEGTEFA